MCVCRVTVYANVCLNVRGYFSALPTRELILMEYISIALVAIIHFGIVLVVEALVAEICKPNFFY